jgi:hypothetical protein
MGEPVIAAPAATIKGFDEYGPLLEWNKHWVNFSVGTRLYTTPRAAPVPLTDDQIEKKFKSRFGEDSWRVIGAFYYEGHRDSEAAHGITKGQA